MKKMIAGLMVSATVLGLALTGGLNVHAAETADAKTATNDATLQVEAGALSMTSPASVAFGTANVATVYADGFDKTSADDDGTTISDFLGDNQDQQVTVASNSGWSDKAMNGNSTLTVTPTTAAANASAAKVATVSTQPAHIATINAGVTKLALRYDLHIDQGTNLSAATTTNTLTWTVGNTAGADQN